MGCFIQKKKSDNEIIKYNIPTIENENKNKIKNL